MNRVLAFALLAAPAALAAQQVDSTYRAISLDEAVALAQQNAPAAIAARGQIRGAESSIRSAYGAFMPNLSWNVTQNRTIGTRVDDRGATSGITNSSTGLSGSMNLFDGGRRLSDLRARRADLGAAEANETAQQFNIALQVKTQYAAVLAARESEAAARSQLEQAEQQLRAATARVRAGAATMSDSLRSVIQLGNARLALVTAQNSLRVASAALTRLVATPYLVTAQASDTLDLQLTPVDSAALLRIAVEGPAVRQAESQLRAANAAARASRTGYLPTLDLTFGRSAAGTDPRFGDPRFSFGSGDLRYSTQLGARFSYPLFNNFTREDQVARASIAQDNAEAQLRDQRFAAQQNILQQLGALRTAEERIRIQQASVAAAHEDLRVQQQRYQLGASTLLDLLTSQSTLNQARAALIQARQDYRLARAQIEAIIGRDLE